MNARAARERTASEREQFDAAVQVELRRMRIRQRIGATVLLIAAAVAVVMILSGCGGTADDQRRLTLEPQSPAQKDNVLGSASAPVTIEEFIDLQCPFCARFHAEAMGDIIDRFVTTGQAKIVLRPLAFVGPGSPAAARGAYAAARQHRMFAFVGSYLRRQPSETAKVSLRDMLKVARAAGGLDLDRFAADMTRGDGRLRADERRADTVKVTGTPTLRISGPGGSSQLRASQLTMSAVTAAVRSAAKHRDRG